MRAQRKLCTSKKIVLASYIITVALTAIALIGVFFTEKDMGPVVTIAGLAWGEVTAANAFYFWKARSENKIKLTKQMAQEWADKYGMDAVVNLAGITLSD